MLLRTALLFAIASAACPAQRILDSSGLPTVYAWDPSNVIAHATLPSGEVLALTAGYYLPVTGDGSWRMDSMYGPGGWSGATLHLGAMGYFLDRSVQGPTGQIDACWLGCGGNAIWPATRNFAGVPGLFGFAGFPLPLDPRGIPAPNWNTRAIMFNQDYNSGPVGHGIAFTVLRIQPPI